MGSRTPLLLGLILLSLGQIGRQMILSGSWIYILFSLGIEGQKNIPEPKLSKFMGPTIKFLYCYS